MSEGFKTDFGGEMFVGTRGDAIAQAERRLQVLCESPDKRVAAMARLNMALTPAFVTWLAETGAELPTNTLPPLIIAAIGNLVTAFIGNAVDAGHMRLIADRMIADIGTEIRLGVCMAENARRNRQH